ncbi:MAG: MBOAT family protein, partial [Planctomycetes bacterium]|nr:MBOAT family protein [Planctomycetota bacterium]
MTFASVDFLAFFAAALVLYWAAPWRRVQNGLLLAASWFFCGYVHPWFCIPLAATAALDYGCALGMRRNPSRRRALLVTSVAAHLGALGVFKYFNFFAESIGAVLAAAGLDVSAPVMRETATA